MDSRLLALSICADFVQPLGQIQPSQSTETLTGRACQPVVRDLKSVSRKAIRVRFPVRAPLMRKALRVFRAHYPFSSVQFLCSHAIFAIASARCCGARCAYRFVTTVLLWPRISATV